MVTSFKPTAAAISPARTSLISERSLACICNRRPMRSVRFLLGTNTWSPDFSVPEYTRKKVRLPTKESLRILNAKAANGAASSAGRVMGSPVSLTPFTGGTSVGEGMYSTMASSTACTPLFLNADPQVTRHTSFFRARSRSPFLISSSVSSPLSKYLFSRVSSPSAAASIILPRHSSHSFSMEEGMSRYSNFMPWVSSSQ